MDHVVADGLDVLESDFNGGDVEVIDRPILERGGTVCHVKLGALHRGDGDRPAREPRTMQFRQRGFFCDQRAQPGGVAEHFIK